MEKKTRRKAVMVLLPEESEVTLAELRDLAARQQQQIEAQQQLLLAKEQRLKFLKQQEARHHQGAQATESERLRPLKDKVETQELKLRRLRALRGQAEQQRASNHNLTAELESIRALFNEKEKELSLAVAKVEELTRQLEELRQGNVNGMFLDASPGNTNALSVAEVEKLRKELLYRTRLNEQQNAKILLQRETLAKRQEEISLIDQRIAGLQQRLHRKRTLNQQLASQIHAATLAKQAQIHPNNNMANHPVSQGKPATRIMRPMATNIAAVEPLKRIPQETCQDDLHATLKVGDEDLSEFMLNKNDPKYQTLPYNTKFLSKPHSRDSSLDDANEKSKLITNTEGKTTEESSTTNSPSSSPPASEAPPPPLHPPPTKLAITGQSLVNLAPRPFGSTYTSANLGHLSKGSGAPSPTTSQSSSTSSNSPAYKTPPSLYTNSEPSLLIRSKLPTSSLSSPPSSRLLPNGHIHTFTSISSSPITKPSLQQKTCEYLESIHSSTTSHGHSDSPEEGSPTNDNDKSKPALPPKPLLPVKPVPPPRQTHVVGIASTNTNNNSNNGTKRSDVDSALMVLKGSTARSTKSGNGYRYVMKPPTHNYSSRLPVGSSTMDQYTKAINHIYRNEMQNQQLLSSSSDKSETECLQDNASTDTESSKRLGLVQMPIQARPLTIKKPSGLDPPRLRSSGGKRQNEVNSPNSQLQNLTGLQLGSSKRIEDANHLPNGTLEGEDTTDKSYPVLSSPVSNKSFSKLRDGAIEGADTLQKEIDLLVDRFNGNTNLDSEANLDSQQSNSELTTEDENELLSDSRKSARSDSSSETPQHDDSEGSYSGLMVNNSAVFRRVKKGNLKTKGSAKNPRRVSFDPLALLLDASLEGELELVKKTAREVTNPSAANDEGITALHNAICAGHLEIVKFLVEFGCDVNAQDSDGWTPLHCAASCNNLPMVKFLVDHGACIFATTLSDHETAAEKCEEDEEGFDGCSEYLYSIQEKLGILNAGAVYGVYDYEAQNPDELGFKEGEMLVILRKGDDLEREWWWSKLRDREGYIPRNLLGLQPRVTPRKEQ